MVIICPTLCISGCAQGSSELSYRQVAARDYRVPEGIDRHSVRYGLDYTVLPLFRSRIVLLNLNSLTTTV
jgi:hypothetical protein